MFSQPQEEHKILDQLVGEWVMEQECKMGPDQPPMKSESTISTRSLGGLWIVSEMVGPGPDGAEHRSIMSIGFDPKTSKYPGTFIASMMTHLWIYSGTLSADKKRLVLAATGPKWDGEGTAEYEDIIEFVDKDNWNFLSQIKGDDGKWTQFMTSKVRRKK